MIRRRHAHQSCRRPARATMYGPGPESLAPLATLTRLFIGLRSVTRTAGDLDTAQALIAQRRGEHLPWIVQATCTNRSSQWENAAGVIPAASAWIAEISLQGSLAAHYTAIRWGSCPRSARFGSGVAYFAMAALPARDRRLRAVRSRRLAGLQPPASLPVGDGAVPRFGAPQAACIAPLHGDVALQLPSPANHAAR